MADLSVKSIASSCLGVQTPISVRRDILCVYGTDNPQNRSLRQRLNLIENNDFVRVALITIQGASPTLQRDLDNGNTVYSGECGRWIYCAGSSVVSRPDLLTLDQDDCSGSGHSVSDEEDELFDLGRNMGANIVCYYINGDAGGFRGCAAHPPDRRGFWVGSTASPWTFVHKLTHIVGDNSHSTNTDNLMINNTGTITNAPPDLTNSQCNNIGGDPDVESCP